MAITETIKRVQRARTGLLIDQPFFGVLALQLHVIESTLNNTAWTDGSSMGFNPAFVATLSNDQLQALICHEVMHCACGHPWREDGRNHGKWNRAADYAINPILVDAGMTLPDGGLIDPQYHGKSAEWIFDRLADSQDDPGDSGQGECLPSPDDSNDPNAEPAPTESDWQQLTKQAIQAAKTQGKLPGSMLRDLEQVTQPIVDWRSLLRRYLQDVTTSDYTWAKPNRRYMASGFYLPSLHSHAMGKIGIVVDTSGSIDAITLAQFCGEMQAIVDDMQPRCVDVIYCDAHVHSVETFERGEMIAMHPKGGGGTSFAPAFEHYDQSSDDQPVVLVYFTDMYGSFPDQAPDYPVIWASTSSAESAPFGDVVPINQ